MSQSCQPPIHKNAKRLTKPHNRRLHRLSLLIGIPTSKLDQILVQRSSIQHFSWEEMTAFPTKAHHSSGNRCHVSKAPMLHCRCVQDHACLSYQKSAGMADMDFLRWQMLAASNCHELVDPSTTMHVVGQDASNNLSPWLVWNI